MKKNTNLKPSYAELEELMAEYDRANLKLHRELVKRKSNELSLKNRIKVLEDELEEEKRTPKVRDLLDEIGKNGLLPPAGAG